MHLLAPWWLLLFLPLAAGLIILYLLKLRRRDFVVPSVFLWEQVLLDLQANVPLQKLRRNLLLLIQLLILLLAVIALSRPAMEWTRKGGRSVVLIIDASASMQSTDVAPSRFAVARREAHKTIEALGPRDSMLIVAVGSSTQALTSFTTDTRALHAALDRLAVSDGRADLRGALSLVAGLVNNRKDTQPPRVEIISDGAVPPLTLPAGFDLPIHFVKIGKRSDNVGIVMLDVRRRVSRRGGFEGLLVMKNTGTRARRFTLELSLNDKLWDARELTLAAGAQRTEVLQALPPGGGVLTAALDLADDLAVDNSARVIVPKLDPIPVALVTDGNTFLETALRFDPQVTLRVLAHVPADLAPGSVLVADNLPVAKLPKDGAALLIGPRAISGVAPATRGAEARAPAIADWNRRHPVLANVDLTGTFISTGVVLRPDAGAQVLIDTDAGPLAVVSESRGRRVLALGWDVRRSDFPLRIGFPIFIGNCIDWLSGARQRAGALNVRTGQVVQVPLPSDAGDATVRLPNGRTQPLGAGAFTPPFAGIYTVTAGRTTTRFAANLTDAGESNLLPRTLAFSGPAARIVGGPVRTEHEFWRWLAVLALVGICLEWWVFHRRIG